MKILLALNSFKGASYSLHVNNALKKGLQKYFPPEQITVFPLCDGGDGSIEALRHHHQWSTISIATQDALGKPIKAQYLWDKNQATAYIELAKASGLANLQGKRNNIMIANTIGTGVLINNAIQKGAKKIILMVGGSATNDAGIGILHSLGVRFLTNSGKEIPPLPRNIPSIRSIDDRSVQRLRSIEVEIWTDVTNPFTGPKGAVTIYGPQKGASPSQLVVLERDMLH